MLYGLILTIHLIVCVVLIAVILFQAGRGGGLADTFGGSAAQSLFGTRGAVYLTRATTVCAIIFMGTSLSLAILSARSGRSLMQNVPAAPAAAPATKQPTPAPVTQPTQEKSEKPRSSNP